MSRSDFETTDAMLAKITFDPFAAEPTLRGKLRVAAVIGAVAVGGAALKAIAALQQRAAQQDAPDDREATGR